jgi:hypothetical protein
LRLPASQMRNLNLDLLKTYNTSSATHLAALFKENANHVSVKEDLEGVNWPREQKLQFREFVHRTSAKLVLK